MWVRGLKHCQRLSRQENRMSHPMWVRGLKLNYAYICGIINQSHPMWVRGLKRHLRSPSAALQGRTLCGCVD